MFAMLNIPGVIATIKNGIENTIKFIKTTFMEIKRDIALTIYRIQTFSFDTIKWSFLAVLITLLTVILKNPLEFITRVFCAIIVSVAFVFYYLTTIPPFHWLAFALWFFFKYMVGLLLYTLVSGIIFVIIALVFGLVSILNFMTTGALNKMALCQTSPLAWHQIPSYQMKNYYERALFCKKPCAMGFAPDKLTGDICERIPLAQPNFCPQASVMRVLNHEMGMTETGTYSNYITTPTFMSKSPEEKEKLYINFFMERQKFFDSCDNTMRNYTSFANNVCANLDAIKANKINGLTDSEIGKLENICKQGFCNSQKRYAFCGVLNGDNSKTNSTDGLLKSITMLVIYTTMFLLLIFTTYKLVSSMKFADLPFTKKSK